MPRVTRTKSLIAPWKIEGHKIALSWSGAGDDYAHGRCECGGWHYRGWTHRQSSVRRSHQAHLRQVLQDMGYPVGA
jgi:hypothetical protein